MTIRRVDELLSCIEQFHPRSLTGIREARAVDPTAFDRYCELFLTWAVGSAGEAAIHRAVAAFSRFSSDVNLAQGRYELRGSYEHKSYNECRRTVYDDHETMSDYLWGVYLTNFLWAHHMKLMLFYEQQFLSRLRPEFRIVELAPGHGGWGLTALHAVPGTTLSGIDISAASVTIASGLSRAAGMGERANYVQCDALQVVREPSMLADAVICCFLVEHLEQPDELLRAMSHTVAPGGWAFFTGALTAAQVDHIYEFKRESELVTLAERHGFRVLQTISVSPVRLLTGSRFLPRSMALLMQKCRDENW